MRDCEGNEMNFWNDCKKDPFGAVVFFLIVGLLISFPILILAACQAH